MKVANTGTFFDEAGIKAIVQGNNSPKKGGYIGNKGTGFRSVLNWANRINIFSGEFAVEFSKNIASDLFESIRREPQIAKQLKVKSDLYIPMLSVPQNIIHNREKDKTTIEIEIDSEKLNDDYSVEKQLQDIDMRILLFLPNISAITIETDTYHIKYERIISNERGDKNFNHCNILIGKIEDGVRSEHEEYTLFRRILERCVVEDEKDVQLAIAVPLDGNVQINHIYSYFPLLDADSPFNCVLHATYSLGDHRNTITHNFNNKEITIYLLDLLIKVAKYFISQNKLEYAYRILLPKNHNYYTYWYSLTGFSAFQLEDYYIRCLANEPLFSTVNNKYISLKDNPKVIEGTFPVVFRGNSFANLLQSTEDKNQSNLVKLITSKLKINTTFTEDELCGAINSVSHNWSISDQVKTFIWWNNEKHDHKLLPQLLKNQLGEWLNFGSECYFLEGDFDSVSLPEWVKIPALDEEYQKQLVLKAKNDIPEINEILGDEENGRAVNVIRYICQHNIFCTIRFRYRDRSNIISAIDSSVKNYDQSVQFVKWLWQYYGLDNASKGSIENSGYSLNFPSKDKKVVRSDKLYFGDSYGNTLAKKIFHNDYYEFPEVTLFSVSSEDTEKFMNFIRRFGIRDYPQIVQKEIEKPIHVFCDKVRTDICKKEDNANVTVKSYYLPIIDNLPNILKEELSMIEVIKWLLNDAELYDYLDKPFCSPNTASVLYHCYRYKKDRTFNEEIENYILATFNNTPWVEIGEERYAPKQVLNGISNSNKKFANYLPILTTQIVEDISKKLEVSYKKTVSVFEKFEFAKNVTDLSSDEFYGLLLELQDSEDVRDMDLSRSIYRKIEDIDAKKEYDFSVNKCIFFNKGKLLVKYKGSIQYWKATESYLPSPKILNKKVFPIVDKGQRTNNSNFVRIFGCKEYNGDYKVLPNSEVLSPLNDEFQLYFAEFMKYVQPYAEKNDNVAKHVDKLRVSIVSSIDIVENDDKMMPIKDDYELVKKRTNEWYIVFNSSKYDINLISENIENIFENIANTPGFNSDKIGELFRSSSKSDREFLIKKEFGTLDVIDNQYDDAIKRNFLDTLRKFDPSLDIDEYDIDFNDLNSKSNTDKVITLFKRLNIDVSDFAKAGFVYHIDLCEYWRIEIGKIIRKEQRCFKNFLFCEALNNQDLQKKFLSTIHDFENSSVQINVLNSVNFDPVMEIVNKFGDWRSFNENTYADQAYKENYERMNPEDLFKDEISVNKDVQQMIYFGREQEFHSWLNAQKQADSGNLNIMTTPDDDPYSSFRGLIPNKEEIEYKSDDYTNEYTSNAKGGRGTAYSLQKEANKNAKKKRTGNIGELLVYNSLCNEYGESSVRPNSEAFVELGILKPGLSNSDGYDISYIDENGTEFYVEIKTSETNGSNRFYMSPRELEFAKTHSSNYRLYYVYVSADPKYKILPECFWDDCKFRMEEIVEKKFEFTF